MKVAVLILSLFFSSVAFSAISYVGLTIPSQKGGTPFTSSTYTPFAADDALIMFAIDLGDSGQTLDVSTTSGTFIILNPPGQFSEDVVGSSSIAAYNLAESASSQTVTVSSTMTGANISISGLEFSGVGSVTSSTATAANVAAGGTILGTAVTVPAGDVLVAICYNLTGSVEPTSSATNLHGDTYPNSYLYISYVGSGASITPQFASGDTETQGFLVEQWLLAPPSGGSCTHSGITPAGAIAVPNGTSGSYVGKTGSFVTPNCSSTEYWQPTVGNFGAN